MNFQHLKKHMEICELLANSARSKGNSQVGCVIVKDNKIIASAEEAGHSSKDVTCHAEMEAIRKARKRYGTDLSECTLVSTHEPCVMCGYAIRFHKLGKVVYKNEVDYFGSITSEMPVLRTLDVPDHWSSPPKIIKLKKLQQSQMKPLDKLKELKLSLPEISAPGGNYVSLNIRENIAYLAIQFPINGKDYLYQGRLGNEIARNEGYKAMELCALNVLAQVNTKIGFDNVIGLNHIEAYFQSGENWDDSPIVVDGASDLFVKVLGDKGIHSRAIFGVDKLPKDFCVGLTASFTIDNETL